MANINVTVQDGAVISVVAESATEAARAEAVAAAAAALQSAGEAAEFAGVASALFDGTIYEGDTLELAIAAGLAGTESGQEFLVRLTDATGRVYLNDDGTAVARRLVIKDPTDSGTSALLGHIATGTGAVARTVQAKLGEQLRSTSDYTTLATAINEAGADGVFIPEGTISGSSPIVATGDMNLVGRSGNALLRRTAGTGVTAVNFLQSGGALRAERVAFDLDVDASVTSGLNLFEWDNDDVEFSFVQADGSVVINPVNGGNNTFNNMTRIPATATEDKRGLRVIFSKFKNFYWGFLKANSTASTERDIDILFSEFKDFASVALLFNSPAVGSLQEFIKVIGNRLGANHSRQDFGLPTSNPSATFPHRATFAGNVENVIFALNQADGDGGEMVRAEEGARAVLMVNNTAKLNGRDGIEIICNDAGGTLLSPRLFGVLGNVLDHRGLVSATQKGGGILLFTPPAFGRAAPLTESVVAHNVVSNFDRGIRTYFGMRSNLIKDNVLTGNGTSLEVHDPSLTIRGNLSLDPTVRDIRFEQPGLLGKQHFGTKASGARKAVVSTFTGKSAMSGWTWESGRFDITSTGINLIRIVNVGDRISGRVKVALRSADIPPSNWSFQEGTVAYDGTTLTYTSSMAYSSGVAPLSGQTMRLDAGDLVVAINASSLINDLILQVEFEGLHVWGSTT
jgi:hypothetical protein